MLHVLLFINNSIILCCDCVKPNVRKDGTCKTKFTWLSGVGLGRGVEECISGFLPGYQV